MGNKGSSGSVAKSSPPPAPSQPLPAAPMSTSTATSTTKSPTKTATSTSATASATSPTAAPATGDTAIPKDANAPVLGDYVPPKDEAAFKKKYQLKGVLGNGNYSVVRKAVDLSNGEQVAVKCVDKRKLTKEDEEALKVEVSVLACLTHPNIIRLFDWYEEPKTYFVVTELMAGGELFDRIVKKEFYSEVDAQRVVLTLASCIKYLHDRKIAHRDLKPENILLKDGKDDAAIKIADFGFARVVPAKGLTTACGTPGYVACEILSGKPYGVSVDIWSLGVITYILLCGYPPFHHQNQAQLFKLIREGRFVFDSPYWDPVSPEAKSLISSMLTVDVTKRATINDVLAHPWITGSVSSKDITPVLTQIALFNARRKLRASIRATLAANRLVDIAQALHSTMDAAKAPKE